MNYHYSLRNLKLIKMKYIIFFLSFFFLTDLIFSQSMDESLKELENVKKEYKAEIKRIKKSILFVKGELLDFNLGGTCGSSQAAGIFLFRITESKKKLLRNKRILIIIQCAGSYPVGHFKKASIYKLEVSKEKIKGWADITDDKFEDTNIEKYYAIKVKKVTQ